MTYGFLLSIMEYSFGEKNECINKNDEVVRLKAFEELICEPLHIENCWLCTENFYVFDMSWISYSGLTALFYLAIGGVLLVNIIRHGYGFIKFLMQYWQEQSKIHKFAKLLPGPKPLPILGNALELWETDKTIVILVKIGRQIKSGLYKFWLGPTVVKFIVSNPDDLEIIFASSKAADKDEVYQMMQPATVKGLINAPGSSHYRAHKKLMMPQINGKSVMGKYIELFNHHSRICVKVMEKAVDAGEFDVVRYMDPLMGDIVFETLFAIKSSGQTGKRHEFIDQVQGTLHALYYRMLSPWLYPDFIFRLTKSGKLYYKTVKDGHDFLDGIIAERKKNHKILSPEETSELCLLDFLIDHRMRNKDWTDNDIRDEAVSTFVASYETVTGLICFALLMMAMYPDIQKKAREEVLRVAKNEDVSESDLVDMKYLEMIMRETIRLFPVAPLMPRKLKGDLKLSKFTAPKGSSLFLLPYAAHKDPDYWDEPEKFNPDRFTPENSENRHPYAYIPFSAGMRSCPGSKYGMICLKVIAAHILRNYELTTNMQLEKLKIHAHISARSADGYKMFIKKL